MGDHLKLWDLAVRTARLMVGIPDYETYLEHRRAFHPGSSANVRTLATPSARGGSEAAAERDLAAA